MPFDWKQYHALAQELGKHNEEAALRSAISRAYYAAYCTARNRWVKENGSVPLDVNAHQFIWNEFRSAKDRLRRFIGTDGIRILKFRNDADYQGELPDIARNVQTTLVLVEKTLDNLGRL